VLGTRERPCPHRPCWEPENGRARSARTGDQRAGRHGGTGPSGGPHAGNPAGFLEFTYLLTRESFLFFLFSKIINIHGDK
jgi:hypothetical protein